MASELALAGQRRRNRRWSAGVKARTGFHHSRRARQKNRLYYLVARAKHRAAVNGLEFDLVAAEMYRPTHCPILGVELDYLNCAGTFADNTISLDRVNNERGYVKDNVRIISRRANMLKSRFSDPEIFRRLADYIEGKI